jgi:hypothetical protein
LQNLNGANLEGRQVFRKHAGASPGSDLYTRPASDRSFGLLLCAVTGLLACYCFWKGGAVSGLLLSVLSGTFCLAAIFAPRHFNKPKRAWLSLGDRIGHFVSPVVVAILFFGVITPVAYILRSLRHDPLRLRKGVVSTYWIVRRSSERAPSDFFKQQF